MDQFLGSYRGHRIFSIEALGAFRVEGLTPHFLSFTKAQLAVDEMLAELEAAASAPTAPVPFPAPVPSPAPAPARDLPAPTSDAAQGMAWWSDLPEDERAAWLQRAGSDIPADAWAAFKAQAR
jgi:hypothetical protein